jgi:hypothetical protein
LACQSATLPEYLLARPQPSFVLCASARGAITDALGSLSYALDAGAAMIALAAIATAFQGRLARKS